MRHLLLPALLLAACSSPPSVPPAVTLTAGADTVRVAIAEDGEAAWLGGERFAVLSPSDNSIVLLDLAARTVTPLKGGAHLQHPARIFALGDTLFVSDWGIQRVTAWTADGRFVRDEPLPSKVRGAIPAATDDRERLYAAMSPEAGPDGSGNRDSSAVVRVTGPDAAPDTVARLTPFDLARVQTDQGIRFDRRVFSGEDFWGVTPDGAVWVARHYHNRVDWRDTTGRWHRGMQLKDRILEVTQTDRERFIARFPPDLRRTAELLQFAPIKPPFVRAFGTADGHVFLEKSRHISDTMQVYHEVGRDGNFIRAIQVHGWSRLLAASSDKLLLSVPDSGGGFTMGVVDRADRADGSLTP